MIPSAIFVTILSLGITAIAALTYIPVRADVDRLQSELATLDKKFASLEATRIVERMDRAEERTNNLHLYMMQFIPPGYKIPVMPNKRGDASPPQNDKAPL